MNDLFDQYAWEPDERDGTDRRSRKEAMRPTVRLMTSTQREHALWTAACLFAGAFLAIPTVTDPNIAAMACGTGLLVAGVGIRLRQLWAKFVAVFSVTVYGLLIVTQDVVDVFSVLRLMAILTAVLLIWNFDPSVVTEEPEADTPEDESEDMTSLVALMPESRYLDAAIVSRLAAEAWDVEVSVDDDDELFAVTGESPHFLIRAEDRFFVVHNVDQPYFEDPEDFASRVLESRICRAVMEHEAWISVDVLDVEGCSESDPECYRMIAKLLAELIDDSCLAICCPEVGSIHPYQSNFSEKLRSDDPLTALRDDALPPVIHVDEDDPRMLAAVDAARRTWPDFIGAFENRSADQTFSVKAPLRDSTGCEQIWLTVTAVENDVIYGIVGNEPVRLKRYKIDDRARVPLSELSDWMYFDDGELRGGYTIEVLSRVAAERARRRPGN